MTSQKSARASRPKASTKPPVKQVVPPPVIEMPLPPERLWAWAGAAVFGLGLFVGGALIALHHRITGLELSAFRHINNLSDVLRIPMLIGTIAPESLWIAVAAVVVTFLLKLYQLAWQLAAASIAGYGLVFVAKHEIARVRPAELLTGVHVRVHETGMGYPSGHTMIITIVTLILFPYLPKGWRWAVLALVPIVGFSRVYLGVHAPLDVAGGFAAGLFVVAMMRLLPSRLKEFLRFD